VLLFRVFVYCFVYFQVKVKLELCDPEDQFFVDDDNEVQFFFDINK